MAQFVDITWTELKDKATDKELEIQFKEQADFYLVWLQEGVNVYRSKILIETPRNADQADFEDNFQATSNQITPDKIQIWDAQSALAADVTQIDGVNRLRVDAGELTLGTVYTVPPFTTTSSVSGNQTNLTLATPTAGKRLQVVGVLMTSDASLFTATVEFVTSGIVVQQHFEQNTLGSYIPSNLIGATDEVLSFTVDNSVGKNWYIIVNFAEVDP